jgi:multidrug efflux system outer membrane protein
MRVKKNTMDNIKKISGVAAIVMLLATSCTLPPSLVQRRENRSTPTTYANGSQDSTNSGQVKWREFFKDPNLLALIDTALGNNQELNITLQEINIARNEVRARKGEYLPFVDFGAAGGVEKVGQYTRSGAVEENDEIQPGKAFPNPLGDYVIGPRASWEIDIWRKLRNAKKSAMFRYLSTGEGRNFLITNLIADIATSYYELMALDNQLTILRQNIQIQQNALEIVKLEKVAAKVTQLAVTKFQAEVLKNQSRQYDILQMITETENRINFLVGRFPRPIQRNSETFISLLPDSIDAGIPSQLLENRPDIRQAELDLAAARLDIKVAKANFYPSLRITAGIGLQSFAPQYLMNTPQSLMYSLGADLMAPLINRNAIKAQYYSASSKQIQAAFNYERTVLNAFVEVANQLSNIRNLKSSYDFKSRQVDALTQSINISTGLFKSARADYMEVLMTQRDALESKFDLIDTRMQQMHAMVNIYQALGGGWR